MNIYKRFKQVITHAVILMGVLASAFFSAKPIQADVRASLPSPPFTPYLVKGINANSNDSIAHVSNMTDLNGTLLFWAQDAEHGAELWRSDGTESGTTLVKDIRPGADSSTTNLPLVVLGNQVIFSALDASNQPRLWRSDGTLTGTQQISDAVAIMNSAVLSGEVYFSRRAGPIEYTLAKTDGTPQGTVDVSATRFSRRLQLARLQNQIIMLDMGNQQLWRTDGTAAGTQRWGGLPPLPNGALEDYLYNPFWPLMTTTDRVYFLQSYYFYPTKYVYHYERILWGLGGSLSGLKNTANWCEIPQLSAFNDNLVVYGAMGPGCSRNSYVLKPFPNDYTDITQLSPIHFQASTQFTRTLFGSNQQGLWISDGTPPGTHHLITVTDQTTIDEFTVPVLSGNHLFFAAVLRDQPTAPKDLWAVALDQDANVIFDMPTTRWVQPSEYVDLPIALVNAGLAPLQSPMLTVTLPASFTYRSDTTGITPTALGNSLIWPLTDIQRFEQKPFVLRITVPATALVGMHYPIQVQVTSPLSLTGTLSKSLSVDLVIVHQTYLPLSFR